jgi:peptide chain release factor 1
MDGNGSLFGTLAGNTREVIHKFTVDLPKKHGRGGQSALRFSRLRDEKRHNYVRKVAELAVQHFITNDKVNVAGLVLAGSADFKTELGTSDLFDPRLAAKVIKIVDVSYGGENGFNQAIELAADALSNVKFVQEKKLIQQYFDEISQDTGKYCYGVDDTLKGLELGAVETLIVWENLDITRHTLRNPAGGKLPDNRAFSSSLKPRIQRRLLSMRTKRLRKIARNSSISQLDSRWNRRLTHKVCSSGSPKSTRSLARISRYVEIPLTARLHASLPHTDLDVSP